MASKAKYALYFHQRLFLLLIVFSWTLVACFVAFQYGREKQFKVEQLNSQMQILNAQIIDHIEDGRQVNTFLQSRNISLPNLRLTIIDLKGNVIYDSKAPKIEEKINHKGREEVVKAMKYGSGYTIRRLSESTHTDYFYSTTKADKFIVRTALPYSISLTRMLKGDSTFLWIMIGLTMIFSITGYIVTRQLGYNIKRLREFAIKAGKGEEATISEPFPHDELGDISNQIVNLYVQLKSTMQERDKEKGAALHEAQEKIRIKRELTNNINHELKTPVASIRGYIETLLDHPELDEKRKTIFLQKSFSQTERLADLLRDITTIARLDEPNYVQNNETVDVKKVILEIISEARLRPEAEKINIHFETNKEISIHGDASLIHSIFGNLTDNAIAYSNGTDIYISLWRETIDYYWFRFYDNGMGVEPKHLEKLFDRFYRVDKGRSRKLGGTGLGLAIVKNAVIQHGGQIVVNNREEGGLEFTFSLKK